MTPGLTVVVTSFKRAKFLARCLKSVAAAGCSEVVISCACPDKAVQAVISNFSKEAPWVRVFASAIPHDLGCNELWLRGIYYATTPYVLVLHDDDFLDPSFGSTYRDLICQHLDKGVGLVSWRGAIITGEASKEDKDAIPAEYFNGATRILGTAALSEVLLDKTKPAVSPGVSIWRRDVAIQALKEAHDVLTTPESYSRPGMMLGNEVLTYLRHCERFDKWFYINKVLTYFGSHPGSESVSMEQSGKYQSVQLPKTNVARDYFLKHRGLAYQPHTRFLLTRSEYVSSNRDEKRRNAYAASTWKHHENNGEIYFLPVFDGMLTRSSRDLGDTRKVPFIRDLLDYAVASARPEDVALLTNTDTCVTVDGIDKLRAAFANPNLHAAYGFRHNIPGKLSGPYKDLRWAHADGGIDLIAVRPAWWQKCRDYFPSDMVMGCQWWDHIMRDVINESQPGIDPSLRNLIYHEIHEPFWDSDVKIRTKNPGQVVNWRASRNFLASRGLPH